MEGPAAGFALPGSLAVNARAGLDILERAADNDLRPLFVTEVSANDACALLAAFAATRPQLVLGSGIIPLGSRSVAALAMAAATVSGLSEQEFLLGVGVSTPGIVEGWHGARWDPSVEETVARLRDLRQLLDGHRRGAFRLASPPGGRARVLLGALGPRMTAAGLRNADGVITNLTPAHALPAPDEPGRLLSYVWVATSDAAEAAARRELVGYATTGPYGSHFRRLGFGAAVDQVVRLQAAGRLREAPALLPDELVALMLLAPEQVPGRLDEFRAAGATPVLLPLGGRDDAPSDTTARFFTRIAKVLPA